MKNIFTTLDAYWDGLQSWVDEYRELPADRLHELLDINRACLEKIEKDPEHYWEWRNAQSWASHVFPERQGRLDKVATVCKIAITASSQVLLERGLLEKLPPHDTHRNVRSNIAADIEKYWVGKPKSNIGIQYLRLVDGIVTVANSHERRDLLVTQFSGMCNVFVDPDGSVQIDCWSGVRVTKGQRTQIEQIVAKEVEKHAEYFKRENRFFQEKPWLQVHGMTPAAALQKLTELGWGPEKE